MKHIFSKLLFVVMGASLTLLVALLQVTTPKEGGAVAILAVFVLGYVFIVCLLSFFMSAVSRIFVRFSGLLTNAQRAIEPLSLKKAYYYASVIALAPVIIIGMKSVDTLGVYEFGLVILLVSIGCFYVMKRTA